jgi:hypothetical protein
VASARGPTRPTLRANPFPEVTDLFCRLPLSTLFYQPEAVHLGDLLRLLVRPGVRIIVRAWIFKGRRERTGPGRRARLFQPRYPISGQTVSRVVVLLKRKDNSSRGPRRRLRVWLRCREKTHIQVRGF